MKVRMLHHVGLQVDDIEDARGFYVDTVGLHLHADQPPGDFKEVAIWLSAGDSQRIVVSTLEGHHGPHFALSVDDLESAVERLRAAGVDVRELTPPMMNVMFQDPFGNWVELRQPPEVWVDWLKTNEESLND
jgi:catechol 2,3-dioxygenase-like lactoylglutathione lyase family enzyme